MTARPCQRVGCSEMPARPLHVDIVLDDGVRRASSRRYVCSLECADEVYEETASRYAERASS